MVCERKISGDETKVFRRGDTVVALACGKMPIAAINVTLDLQDVTVDRRCSSGEKGGERRTHVELAPIVKVGNGTPERLPVTGFVSSEKSPAPIDKGSGHWITETRVLRTMTNSSDGETIGAQIEMWKVSGECADPFWASQGRQPPTGMVVKKGLTLRVGVQGE